MSGVTDAAADRRFDWRAFLSRNAIVFVFLAFVVFATAVTGGRFLHPSNLSLILFQCSVIGVLVLGQTLVMLIGGIDLSVAVVAILTAIIMGAGGSERQQMMNLDGILPFLGFWQSIVFALLASAFFGFVNGIVTVKFKVPAFIATLAMSLALAGLALLTTGGAPVHYPDDFYARFGGLKLFGMPLPIYVFLTLALLTGIFLSRSAFGAKLYAIGGNARAAGLSGIPVERISIIAYTACGLFAGIAGFLFLTRTGSVTAGSGGSLLLSTIAAAVVGGVSLAGGKGSILHAVIGTLLLAGLGNLMNIMLISPHLQDAVGGVIIIVAIMMNVRLSPD
ncbi:MAG: ABC transporter permease [Bauldia sp.]|nr:ABC transporter permease [Bauldia sp.]